MQPTGKLDTADGLALTDATAASWPKTQFVGLASTVVSGGRARGQASSQLEELQHVLEPVALRKTFVQETMDQMTRLREHAAMGTR